MGGGGYKDLNGSNTAVDARLYPQSNSVFLYTYTNNKYRFVEMPLFEVAQGKLNNFITLVYVVLWSSRQRVHKIKKGLFT